MAEHPDLPAFGLDSGQDWLDLVRHAEAPRPLGTMGAYELIRKVGQGGQGIVYQARQPGTDRVIALKRLVAGGAAGPRTLERFERELRAATSLAHPALVTVFGMDMADEQPVLAMEWVDGTPVNRWADGRGPEDVVEVLIEICDGIHHAHQRGVIHRDLKPSNILVDTEGNPRVLDFGLAKLESEPDLTDPSAFIGTLAYAAPEQIDREFGEVDVRTDVYTLGVIAFEAFTGRLPYELTGDVADAVAMIRERPPIRPSQVRPELGRDGDVILRMALAKEPGRRYQSVDAFGGDLQRWISGEPVLAHPPSTWYQLGKLAQKHRTALFVAGVLLLLSSGLAVFALVSTGEARRERERAERSRVEVQEAREAFGALMNLVRDDVMGMTDPAGPSRAPWAAELLDLILDRVSQRLLNEPRFEADLRLEGAAVLLRRGRYQEGLGQYRRAMERLAEIGAAPESTLLEGRLGVARCHLMMGDFGLAEIAATEALASLADPESRSGLDARNVLAWALTEVEDYAQARREFRHVIRRAREQSWTGEHIEALRGLSRVEARMHTKGAWRFLEQALRLEAERSGDDGFATSRVRLELGRQLTESGRADAAEAELQRAQAALTRRVTPDHPLLLKVREALISVVHERGASPQTVIRYQEVLAAQRAALWPHHPDLVRTLSHLATALAAVGQTNEALVRFEEALAIARHTCGPEHARTTELLRHFGLSLMGAKKLERAEKVLQESLGIERTRRPNGPASLNSLSFLGMCRRRQGQLPQALPLLERAWSGLMSHFGPAHTDTLWARIALARTLRDQGRFDRARKHLLGVLAAQRQTRPPRPAEIAETLDGLAVIEMKQQRFAAAATRLEECAALGRALFEPGHPHRAISEARLAICWGATGRAKEGEELILTAIAAAEKLLGKDHPVVHRLASDLESFYKTAGLPPKPSSTVR